jgi:hypothetical protein
MSFNRLGVFFILFLLSGLTGCAPGLIQLGHHTYPPKPADCDLPIYFGEDKVPHTYIEVCVFSYANRPGPQMNGEEAVSTAPLCKSQACKAGCDALLVEDADVDGADLNPAGRHEGRMALIKGIKFVEPPANPKNEDSTELIYLHVK